MIQPYPGGDFSSGIPLGPGLGYTDIARDCAEAGTCILNLNSTATLPGADCHTQGTCPGEIYHSSNLFPVLILVGLLIVANR